ncbi:MAG: HD domain-containing protein [Lachnospiraceae bacterium]|nr:HD domain-containing protein [Lachnospiraceae bacterium]
MERVNRILHHPDYIRYCAKIAEAEEDRIFCGHDLVHFLDVCRLAWILYLEEGNGLPENPVPLPSVHKEWIYGAGLLHDIGRWKEYEDGIDHALASKELAGPILVDCGFAPGEVDTITEAIGNHRNKAVKEEKNLSGYLYRADKLSRSCFGCRAEGICDWSREKKNLELVL